MLLHFEHVGAECCVKLFCRRVAVWQLAEGDEVLHFHWLVYI